MRGTQGGQIFDSGHSFFFYLKGGPWRMGQDKFRRNSGGVQATQYDPRGSTAIAYCNTVQCSLIFTAIILAI